MAFLHQGHHELTCGPMNVEGEQDSEARPRPGVTLELFPLTAVVCYGVVGGHARSTGRPSLERSPSERVAVCNRH